VTAIDPTTRLADLVIAVPRRAQLLEQLRLDYCCRGDRTLAQACAQRGLDAATVATLIAAFDERPISRDQPHDVARASIAELCEHIISAHHEPLRRELPRMSELLGTVVRVHGTQRPELHDLQRLLTGLRRDLEQHIAVEEAILFPACRAAERHAGVVDEDLLAAHETEHGAAGEALVALRELSGGYERKLALCSRGSAVSLRRKRPAPLSGQSAPTRSAAGPTAGTTRP
jgi:regulator of cell morphogenesis and NO signaling